MTFGSESFTRITDHLVDILRADPNLQVGFEESVHVEHGLPRPVGHQEVVFVYRRRFQNAVYYMGQQGEEVTAVWYLCCLSRHSGDPRELERRVSTLAANLLAVIFAHKGEPGYWTDAIPQEDDAARFRNAKVQNYELEAVPLRVHWFNDDGE